MPASEKRRFPRVAMASKVRYRVLGSTPMEFLDDEAISHNLSLGGLALGLKAGLAKDALVKLEVLEGEAKGLRAYAEVAWTREDAAGLKFMGILEEDVERLNKLVLERLP